MNEKIAISIKDWSYECGDGCCTNYGTTTKVNGFELSCNNQDRETIIEKILQHLGYEVEMDYE